MRIAFVTSEFAGLPGKGGIGSYYRNAARCLAGAGHEIEIFTSGTPGQLTNEKGILFHQLGTDRSPDFSVHAADALVARHLEMPFDLLESSELKAEGFSAIRNTPGIAHVVRLHSPSVVLDRYLDIPVSRWQGVRRSLGQARLAFGALRRGLPTPPIYLEPRPPFWFPTLEREERAAVAAADLVLVMNEEMRRLARNYWWIPDEMIRQVPNPLRAPVETAPLPVARTGPLILGFAGRLEPRKGILELARALKRVLPRHPDWKVVLAGNAVPSCLSGADVGQMAREELKDFGPQVQFLGPLPQDEVRTFLHSLDLCVFPSLWDNFPYAVLEAMEAGKALVATRTGAVAEMLDHGRAGVLIEPGSVRQLVEGLDSLMGDPGRRKLLGDAARERVRMVYSEEIVTKAIEEAYQVALQRRDLRQRKQAAFRR